MRKSALPSFIRDREHELPVSDRSTLKGLERGKKDFGVDFGVITCAMRHHSQEDNSRMIKTAREYLGYGVCAADLAGAEASTQCHSSWSCLQTPANWNALYPSCRRVWKRTEHCGFCKSGSWQDWTWNRHEVTLICKRSLHRWASELRCAPSATCRQRQYRALPVSHL